MSDVRSYVSVRLPVQDLRQCLIDARRKALWAVLLMTGI